MSLFIAIFALHVPLSFARSIPPVIRLDDPGYSMEHVAVHNQYLVDDCYAQAGAQFFDAWRFFLGDTNERDQSSALVINQRYKLEDGEKKFDGGYMERVYPMLAQEGTCSEASISRKFIHLTGDQYADGVMRIYHQEMDLLGKAIEHYGLRNEKRLRDEYQAELILKLKKYHKQVVAPSAHFDSRVIDKLELNQDVVAIFETLGLLHCNNTGDRRLYAPVPLKIRVHSHYRWGGFSLEQTPRGIKLVSVMKWHPKDAIAQIKNELAYGKKALPIGIGYCSTVLKKGHTYAPLTTEDEDCKRHYSLAIGWRAKSPETHKPQILIRNSWGKHCYYYSNDWDCDASKGTVWVDEDVLARSIYETQTVKR